MDDAPTNTQSSKGESQLYIFEDNQVVIKMIIKGPSPTMKHVSRTHRVAFDWLFDRINLSTQDPSETFQTKEAFSRHEWNHLLRLFNTMGFSMLSCRHFSDFPSHDRIGKQSATSKRGQEATSGEGHQWRNQNQWFQRRGDPSTWCYAARGARGKNFCRIWDIRSIRGMSMKDKVIIVVHGDLYGPPKTQKSNVLK